MKKQNAMTQIYWSQLLNNNYIAIGEKMRIMNESYMQRINENYWKNKSEFLRFVCLKKSTQQKLGGYFNLYVKTTQYTTRQFYPLNMLILLCWLYLHGGVEVTNQS